MARWQVVVTVTKRFQVEVEAKNWNAARRRAVTAAAPEGFVVDADPRRQLGEPWVSSCRWYDLHGPGDVVVAHRAFGNRFTEDEVGVLRKRLTVLALTVVDSWNGTGCPTVSFRCEGRRGTEPFSVEEEALLCAPIEERGQ